MKKGHFTLVEILVVSGIIGMLLGVSLSTLNDARARGKFARWLGYKTNLKADPSILVYYDFQEPDERKLQNQASGINVPQYDQHLIDAVINNATWVKGRWKNKGALWMNGVDSYAVITGQNKVINIPREFSMEFWLFPITLGQGILVQSNAGITDESTTVHDVKDAADFSPGQGQGNAYGNSGKNSGETSETISKSLVMSINNQILNFNYIADMDYLSKEIENDITGYAWGTKTIVLDTDRQSLVFNCNFRPEKWYHVILTYSYEDQRIKLYLNGELHQEYIETRPVIYLFGQTWLGGNSIAGNSFNGIIDEFAIYGRALTPYDVRTHYQMGRP